MGVDWSDLSRHFWEAHRLRWQCRSLKIEQINNKIVSKGQKNEMAHLGHTHVVQPPRIHPECAYGLCRPRCWCSQIKFAPINVSSMQKSETAYLRHNLIMQPCRDNPQCSYRVVGPKHQCRQLKMQPTSVSCKRKEQNAHQGPYKPIHLLPRNVGDPLWSMPIGCLQYGLQSLKNNLPKVSHDDKKSNRIKYAPECK